MQIATARRRLLAVLGPTNTGKTHLALERLLAHDGGMIGFPLRLLARENYDRAVRLKGAAQVALITGEEKIAPPGARYFLCTVESMPVDRPMSFLAIDEIQMCADVDRGHVFTERLLHARGLGETMFMGAETARPLLQRLVPDIEIVTRPRFSTLVYAGPRKVTRLPRRSAVVAFSAADVYALAELVRRQRGGAAVVLGALSPRTRNAQVAMYQAGEVDYLVATDAIGMGLNMDVDHVAFAATRKFDGRSPRPLAPAELGQIAGRAGRHMNDGTFGTTAEVGPLDPEIVERIESHRFESLSAFQWRNAELRLGSLAELRLSLAAPPPAPGLVRAREADDEMALGQLARDPAVAARATHPEAVRVLWDVCRIPDFRKILSDAHTRLLRRIYLHLTGPTGRLPTDWVAAQIAHIDQPEGDIDTLVQRIANIRTWTYVAYQGAWIDDPLHWQDRARAVEDRLSDVLHQRLTQRFVDRRAAVVGSRLKGGDRLAARIDDDGAVTVAGEYVGRLSGLSFAPDAKAWSGSAGRAFANAARLALAAEIGRRAQTIEREADDAFALDPEGALSWRDQPVARLARGADVLRPVVETLATDDARPEDRERVRRRLVSWMGGTIAARLAPLVAARAAPLPGAARGIVFQLAETLGSMPRRGADALLAALGRDDRRSLRGLGIRIGRESLFMPSLLNPAAIALRRLLWSIRNGAAPAVAAGRTSIPANAELSAAAYEACGYRLMGAVAVRVDIVERLAAMSFAAARHGSFAADARFLSLAGLGAEAIQDVLRTLGYRPVVVDGATVFQRRRPAPGKARRPDARRDAGGDHDSPFAKLKSLASRR